MNCPRNCPVRARRSSTTEVENAALARAWPDDVIHRRNPAIIGLLDRVENLRLAYSGKLDFACENAHAKRDRVVRRERISGHFMADRPHVIVQRLRCKQRRGRNIGARLCPADWGKPMTKCGVRLKCKVLRARSIECALSVRNEPRRSCSPSKLLPNQIGGSLRPLTAGSPMHGRNDDTPHLYVSVGKCVSCSGTRSATRSPKVSELRQSGVISMHHLYWHAYPGIRDCV